MAHPFLEMQGAKPSSVDSFEFSFDDSADSDEGSFDSNHPPFTRPNPRESPNENISKVGFVDALSPLKVGKDLDWALIEIELPFFKASNRVKYESDKKFPFKYPQNIAHMVTEDCQILAATGSRGTVAGEMSAVPYFIKMPSGKSFQEVRLIRLEDSIGTLLPWQL